MDPISETGAVNMFRLQEFQLEKLSTVFPHYIVSSLEYFPPLNSFRILVRKLFKFSLHKGKIIVTTIFYISRIQKRTVFVETICETTVKGCLSSKRGSIIF